MNDQDRPEEKKFKVTDRRLFNEAGELRPEGQNAPEQKTPPSPRSTLDPEIPGRADESAGRGPGKIDFASFVLSLAGSAMMHMGEGPPGAPAQAENLEAARQMIDILEMLQEKTEGNRTSEENQLMQQILFELQMAFVKKRKS